MEGGTIKRKIYLSAEKICLAEFIDAESANRYDAWNDPGTQDAYNFVLEDTYDEFLTWEMTQRWHASILRTVDGVCVGTLMLSPKDTVPDLAIIIFPDFRGMGYGSSAFALGARYCLMELQLPEIHAGCYTDNLFSLKMLRRCGFIPYPEGNQEERHFQTGERRIQLDFVLRSPTKKNEN